jgi:ATP-binding cassette subfamily F protein 3
MTLLTLNNVSQAFGDFDVFKSLNATMQYDSKVGLVGANGIGKTTLLQILTGITEPSEGSVAIVNGTEIGYLRQEAVQAFADRTNSLYDEMLNVFAVLKDIEARMREIEGMMGDGSASEAEFEEYGTLQETFERKGGYDYEHRIVMTLHGLGFDESHYPTPIAHLSGGQKTRALLARLLLTAPHLLVLDEPTNHLDVEAIAWLEKTLNNWNGALLIVSHDRYFLDKVVNTIWEMQRDGMTTFRGNYSAYVRQRQDKIDYHLKMYEREKERLTQEMDFIKKNINRAATNGMAVGRLRRLSRDLVAIEEMGLIEYLGVSSWSDTGLGGIRPYTVAEAERAIKAIKPPQTRTNKMRVKLNADVKSGDIALRINKLKIGYPTRPLFTTDSAEVPRGAVIALLGGTLITTLLNEIKPLTGSAAFGLKVKPGYFAQAHDRLNIENTVLDELLRHKPMLPVDARHILAQYLFRGDDVYKKVSSLSGGERGRLALAILALEGANFLLLDEPTNHLDIPSQEVLQDVLEDFEGTILLVTHDRYLVDRLATHIWTLRDEHLHMFEGNYEAFLVVEEARLAAEKAARPSQKRAKAQPVEDNGARQLEMQIAALEASLKETETLLTHASAAGRSEDIQRLSRAHHEQQQQLAALVQEWEKVAV